MGQKDLSNTNDNQWFGDLQAGKTKPFRGKGGYSERYLTFQISFWQRQSQAWTRETSVGSSASADHPKRASHGEEGRGSVESRWGQLQARWSHDPKWVQLGHGQTERSGWLWAGETVAPRATVLAAPEDRPQERMEDQEIARKASGEGTRERSSWRPDAAHFCQHQARHPARMLCCAKPTRPDTREGAQAVMSRRTAAYWWDQTQGRTSDQPLDKSQLCRAKETVPRRRDQTGGFVHLNLEPFWSIFTAKPKLTWWPCVFFNWKLCQRCDDSFRGIFRVNNIRFRRFL